MIFQKFQEIQEILRNSTKLQFYSFFLSIFVSFQYFCLIFVLDPHCKMLVYFPCFWVLHDLDYSAKTWHFNIKLVTFVFVIFLPAQHQINFYFDETPKTFLAVQHTALESYYKIRSLFNAFLVHFKVYFSFHSSFISGQVQFRYSPFLIQFTSIFSPLQISFLSTSPCQFCFSSS